MSSDLGGKPDSEPQTEVQSMPKTTSNKDIETKENLNIKRSDNKMPDSQNCKTLPEPLRVGKAIPRLPPIGMAELTSILQGPNMPSQKLMKEVTEKIRIKNDESGSDDGSVSGGGVGMRGILDCILEVSLTHQDSEDESDVEEGDRVFVRELPCRFCKKIFGSTMNLQTHVLMTHSQEDPSVLNINNPSHGGSGQRDKLPALGRSKSIEGKDKDTVHRSRKRPTSGQQESNVGKEERSRDKRVRSRHSSKEQSSKVSYKMEDKSADLSEASSVSSQTKTVRQFVEKDSAKKCDLESAVVITPAKSTEQSTHGLSEDSPSSSKASKRKSSTLSSSTPDSSSPVKKAKRSQCKSGETKVSNTQLRMSLRKK